MRSSISWSVGRRSSTTRRHFFEATTALAFDAFAKADVDVALIETGLGGRLDSTNVVDPVSAGVTSIGWDHMEYLGHTLDAIALEKAGIFKRERPAVIGEPNPDIRELLRRRANRAWRHPLLVADAVAFDDIAVSAQGTAVTLDMFGERARLSTPLAGRHQAFNLAFTLALLHAAGPEYRFTLREAKPLLDRVSLPGRFQRVGNYVFDVAHNADGARVLAETLRAVYPEAPVTVLFCALRDKGMAGHAHRTQAGRRSVSCSHAPTAPASRVWNLDHVREFLAQTGMPGDVEPSSTMRCDSRTTQDRRGHRLVPHRGRRDGALAGLSVRS